MLKFENEIQKRAVLKIKAFQHGLKSRTSLMCNQLSSIINPL